ncbi:endoglucanase-like [Diorhabda carinulata]|uniref:endoglucanase-like n=1 Tax=Diorhabda carinulata TaxID=1163345 RepID=UPI0025A0B088|nr:endoglucanase-like [Diorhabda carinulata]
MKVVIGTILLCVYASAKSYKDENIVVETIPGGLSGTGTTTRYWDCCKPTCAWPGNVNYQTPVKSCKNNGVDAQDPEIQSGCVENGAAYVCNDQSQQAINSSLALGFVAAKFINTNRNMCCSCVKFTFTPQELAGKQMILQVTNTGNDDPDAQHNEFDIAMPGSGVGYYTQGCSSQWNVDVSNWGDQYGGVHSESECYNLPQALWEGCKFRFEWMLGYSNPDVVFEEVQCPQQLLDISGCHPL